MFDTKTVQLTVAKEFAVAEKKLHLAMSGHKYDPGKKPTKRKATANKQKATDTTTPKDQPAKDTKEGGSCDVIDVSEDRLHDTDMFSEPFDNDSLLDDDNASLLDPFPTIHEQQQDEMETQLEEKLFAMKDPSSIPKKQRKK